MSVLQSKIFAGFFSYCYCCCCWVVVVLWHILSHFWRGQLTYPHCFWASLLGNLPVLNAHSFASNWQLPFLNQMKGENGCRIYFMTELHERMLPDVGTEPTTVHIQPSYRARRDSSVEWFGLVWFLFYGPSTHLRSFWAQSVNLATLFLGKPPRQFTST